MMRVMENGCEQLSIRSITQLHHGGVITRSLPDQFKNCSVHPLLKKSNLNKENLSNYRPISHLSYLSKLTERLFINRLVDHLNENNLMISFQSAYTKFNSTEFLKPLYLLYTTTLSEP